jgi:heme-degrading monooxygenase HmoA
MFYRMTRLHFAEERFDDLVELATSLRDRVEGIPGLRFAELIRTGEGEGMIISSYHDASTFQASARAEADVIDDLAALLTSTPHGHEGSVVLSFQAPS